MANPFMGTWKLNAAKSKLTKGSPRNNTVKYEWGFFRVRVTIDGMDKGKPEHNEWVGQFDSREYEVTGDPDVDVRIYRPVDEHTMDFWHKKGGKVVSNGRIVVSADGKSRTVTSWSRNKKHKLVKSVAVYDRVG
jgi:hypothetical protein